MTYSLEMPKDSARFELGPAQESQDDGFATICASHGGVDFTVKQSEQDNRLTSLYKALVQTLAGDNTFTKHHFNLRTWMFTYTDEAHNDGMIDLLAVENEAAQALLQEIENVAKRAYPHMKVKECKSDGSAPFQYKPAKPPSTAEEFLAKYPQNETVAAQCREAECVIMRYSNGIAVSMSQQENDLHERSQLDPTTTRIRSEIHKKLAVAEKFKLDMFAIFTAIAFYDQNGEPYDRAVNTKAFVEEVLRSKYWNINPFKKVELKRYELQYSHDIALMVLDSRVDRIMFSRNNEFEDRKLSLEEYVVRTALGVETRGIDYYYEDAPQYIKDINHSSPEEEG